MWQRFTEHARRVIFFAQKEAGKLNESYVSTEHILLGLIRESESGGAKVITALGVDLGTIRQKLLKQVQKGNKPLGGDMQLSPRAKKVIDLAYDEARLMEDERVCSEHLLLGVLREGEGLGAKVMSDLGVTLVQAQDVVLKMQGRCPRTATKISHEVEIGTTVAMRNKNLMSIADLSRAEIDSIFDLTRKLKTKELSESDQRKILEGKTLAMIFEKPSLRTRVSFETGIFQLGGHGIYLGPNDISLGKRESVADIARTLDRMVDIIMARVFSHEAVVGLAKAAKAPVINALSDLEHPCQALADFYTIIEHKGKLEGLKLAFVGDGNNVAHSLMLLAAKVGMNFTIGCPQGYEPSPAVFEQAIEIAAETGAKIEMVHDPKEAVRDADIVYTDVWASMGQEDEAAEREKIFAPFQVNVELMNAAKEDAIFEHCLPAHRGSEVTDEVIEGKWSVVFDEAENRLHAQKAVMVLLAG